MEIKTHSIDQEAPKIDFPCAYPIKVIGFASETFEALVIAVMELHCGDISTDQVTKNPSKKGNYVSITVTIEARGEQQLLDIFNDLKAIDGIKMVL